MDGVKKVYFDPLHKTKAEISAFLKTLPVGSAHPYNGSLLITGPTNDKITTVDISKHADDYFMSSISLADIGEDVLDRMKLFSELSTFSEEYSIQQAPGSTFTVPIEDGSIHIFAVSSLKPNYYDLCMADARNTTVCFNSQTTFRGLKHSGDIRGTGGYLLQHIIVKADLDESPRCVFVSGYTYTQLTLYKEKNPLVVVINHQTKTLYVVPVPLDEASIGKALLCTPLVIKKNKADGTLVCSILSRPTTDDDLMCSGDTLNSPSFVEAIRRADFNTGNTGRTTSDVVVMEDTPVSVLPAEAESESSTIATQRSPPSTLFLATDSVTIPELGGSDGRQVIRFGKGITWLEDKKTPFKASTAVLPCVLGGVLEGSLLLALGKTPLNFPFKTTRQLHSYYQSAKTVIVVVDDKMTDMARNTATSWRINAVFIVSAETTKETDPAASVIENVSINAVTALAGPQSLVLVQIEKKYYFYRGIANPAVLDTTVLKFGQDITEFIEALDLSKLLLPNWPRIIDITQQTVLYLPKSKQELELSALKSIFDDSGLDKITALKDDILMIVPQLQVMLPQEKLQAFCAGLIASVNDKIDKEVAQARKQYAQYAMKVRFPRDHPDYNDNSTLKSSIASDVSVIRVPHKKRLKTDFDQAAKDGDADAEFKKKRIALLTEFRRMNKEAKEKLEWLTQALGNVVSAQTASKKIHDIKRLVRQNKINSNVDAVKSMNFENLAGLLEDHASEMGVLIANIRTSQLKTYMSQLKMKVEQDQLNAADVCRLDSRTLYLEGLDAGIILEQSQAEHDGPLVSMMGKKHPILALPYLNKNDGDGSMLAWACWDEFVNLEDPYTVRWMEKCNDAHIAALRIIMRDTLSSAVCSRELQLTPQSSEIGKLMSSLLMGAMFKLAAMKTTPPGTVANPEDTSMRLMRGLFGHLMTIAGSGTQPMSYVWQLFGTIPQFNIPSSDSEWTWYENTIRLVPYTGWPLEQFKTNLFKLLDKVIFRAITKNEIVVGAAARSKSYEDYCKLRNIQLEYMRTIVYVLEKMLHMKNHTIPAKRMLHMLPADLENPSTSYTRMRRYIEHLSNGGKPRECDNLIAANVITRRSGIFKEEKMALAKAANEMHKAGNDNAEAIKAACEVIYEKRAELAKRWGLTPSSMHMQCAENIQAIIDAIESAQKPTKDMLARATGDVEMNRVPWHVGRGEDGEMVEALNEDLVKKILKGGSEVDPLEGLDGVPLTVGPKKSADPFEEFADTVEPKFLLKVKFADSVEDICAVLKVSEGAFLAMAGVLVEEPALELGLRFREVVLRCLRERNRESYEPSRELLEKGRIEGA